jgi:hypothetical protein
MEKTMSHTEFRQAAQEPRASLVSDFLFFLKENKKWWLLPFLVVLTLLAFLAMVSTSSFAPFIYTLF